VSLTITRGANSVTLPTPEFGNTEDLELRQVTSESVDATVYVYDRGVEVGALQFRWVSMDHADLVALQNFFRTHAEGMKNTVDLSWPDWRPAIFGGAGGTVTKAGYRFATPRIMAQERRNALYRVTLVFQSN